jgi:Leucine-rich repeat (LRR) protein
LLVTIISPAQTARSNETEKQNNEVNRLLDVEAIEILRCNVSRLTDDTFSGIVRASLRFLDLSYNVIQTVDSETFSGMVNLLLLDLSNNNLHSVTDAFFGDLHSLRLLEHAGQ